MDDLDILQPEPKIVCIQNEDIEITPLKFKQFGVFIRTVKPIVSCVNEMINQDESQMTVQIAELLSEHCDNVLKAVSIATGKSEDWVGQLNLADAIDLTQTVIEVNLDFFVQRMMPTFNQAVQNLTARLDGSVSSNV